MGYPCPADFFIAAVFGFILLKFKNENHKTFFKEKK